MDIQAKKSLGQNFLSNPRILDKIVSIAELSADDVVIEIGPGTGNLTKKLAEKTKKVLAIEKDNRLIEPLKKFFRDNPNIEIIEADILKFKTTEIKYKVVANIPYYLTSILLHNILEEWPKPDLVVLTIQKEVAQRIIAKPPHMNLLALSVQYYSDPKIMGNISKNNFQPVPKVDSAIIKLKPKDYFDKKEATKLFNLAKIGFSEKRKQLAGTLAKHLRLKKEDVCSILKNIDINPQTRPENLSLDKWIKLSNTLSV